MSGKEPDKNQGDLLGSMARMDALQNLATTGNQEAQREFLSVVTNYLAKATATLTNPQVLHALQEDDRLNSREICENSIFGHGIMLDIQNGELFYDKLTIQSPQTDAKNYGPKRFAILGSNNSGRVGFVIAKERDVDSYRELYWKNLPQKQREIAEQRQQGVKQTIEATQRILGGIWQLLQFNYVYKSHKYVNSYWFREINPQDFMKYPELFPIFVRTVDTTVERATKLLAPERAAILDVLKQNITTAEQAAKAGRLTNQEIGKLAQEIAQGAIFADPVLQNAKQQGLSEQQVKEIVTAVVEERLAAMQVKIDRRITTLSADVQQQILQLAGNDKNAQAELTELAKGYRNPERVFRAALKIVGGFIPGAQGIVAIIDAANELFGPPDVH